MHTHPQLSIRICSSIELYCCICSLDPTPDATALLSEDFRGDVVKVVGQRPTRQGIGLVLSLRASDLRNERNQTNCKL